MFGFIRSNSFTAQAMIPVVGLILFGIAWAFPGNLQSGTAYGNGYYYLPPDGWMYPAWLGMARLPLWIQIAPSCLTAILSAMFLVRMDMTYQLMVPRSYTIAFVFLFLLASSGHFFLFHPAMVAGLFMLLSIKFLLGLYKEETHYSLVFAMGFCWGLAAMLYPPVSFLIPALLIGLLLMVATNWRHWLVILTGITLPAVLSGAFWFLMGDLDYEMTTFLFWFQFRSSGFVPGFIEKEPFLIAWLGLILIWVTIASAKYRNPKIQSNVLFQTNFLLFISTLILTVVLKTVSVEILWILIIPVSFLMAFWALKVEKWWKRDLFFFSLLLFYAFFRVHGLI